MAQRQDAPSRSDEPTALFDGAFRLVAVLAAILVLLVAIRIVAGGTGPSHGAPGGAPGAQGGPPPIPPYQMRAERSATGGEAMFTNRCGSCHLAGGMGTNLDRKSVV